MVGHGAIRVCTVAGCILVFCCVVIFIKCGLLYSLTGIVVFIIV